MAYNPQSNTSTTTQQPQQRVTNSVNEYLGKKSAHLGLGGEHFEGFYKVLTEAAAAYQYDAKFVKLLQQLTGCAYGGVAVCKKVGNKVAAHILVVESTLNKSLGSVQMVYNNTPVSIDGVPSDAINQTFFTRCKQLISEQLAVNYDDVIMCEFTLVPKEIDSDVKSYISNLLGISAMAIKHYESMSGQGEELVRVDDSNKASNVQWVVETHYNNANTSMLGLNGLPYRADVCISLNIRLTNGQQTVNDPNSNDANSEVLKVYGYFDFIPNYEHKQRRMLFQNPHNDRVFVPNFIITNMTSGYTLTPELALLGISLASKMSNGQWMQAFRPVISKNKEVDFNNLGVLNILGNAERSPSGVGEFFKLDGSTEKVGVFHRYIAPLIEPSCVVSLELSKIGPTSWWQSILEYALVQGNPESKKALADCFLALTNNNATLTNLGAYKSSVDTIHSGYVMLNGSMQPIQAIDNYVAYANWCYSVAPQNFDAMVDDWVTTHVAESFNSAYRAGLRLKMLSSVVNGDVCVKETAMRVKLSPLFIKDIVDGLNLCGFRTIDSSGGSGNIFTQSHVISQNEFLLNPQVVLNSGYSGYDPTRRQQGFYNAYQPQQGRWM